MQRKKDKQKGTEPFPSSFVSSMSTETQIETIKKLLEPLLEDDIFLVDIRIRPTNNIKIYLDADGGLGIEKCIKVNRALYKQLEEAVLYADGDFSLEISSPGIDEPLKMLRQYHKNLGRNVEVITTDGNRKEGKLTAVDENEISIEYTEGKGKKAVVQQLQIPFTDIKQTKVLIKF
ncbi:MAG: ribosome assembly cofactor RimP [Ferruginibacter sp.]